ncbi:hypothetical protein KKB68_01450 [Patescibacteria group bacterium]|nr:hypothetical protein [Patescibacteria group bacterium]
MNPNRVFGWFLLIAGVIIILYSLYSSFNIFTGAKEAPEIFKAEKEEIMVPQKTEAQDPQSQIEEMIGEQLRGMIPTDSLPTLFNLISWSIFTSLLVFGGGQLSNIGIKLIKR